MHELSSKEVKILYSYFMLNLHTGTIVTAISRFGTGSSASPETRLHELGPGLILDPMLESRQRASEGRDHCDAGLAACRERVQYGLHVPLASKPNVDADPGNDGPGKIIQNVVRNPHKEGLDKDANGDRVFSRYHGTHIIIPIFQYAIINAFRYLVFFRECQKLLAQKNVSGY